MTYAELEARVLELKKQLEEALRERDEYRKLYELTTFELERLRRHVFGRKAERVDPAETQRATDDAGQTFGGEPGVSEQTNTLPNAPPSEVTTPPAKGEEPKQKPKERKITPHGRQKLPEHLHVERIELLPAEAYSENAASLVRIGEEVSETLEWRPASFVRLQIVRPKFVVKGEPERGVFIAPAPEAPIARCMAGPGLLAHVLVNKFADHLPLHRQEGIFARSDISLARSTLCGWVAACAGMLGYVVEAMAKDAHHSPWIAIDATGVLVQAKEKCRRGYFWVLVASDDHVLFRYTKGHNQQGPKAFLAGYDGYVIADAHSVYEELYRTEKVTEVGCWAHSRRRFFHSLSSDKERALVALGFIGRLYAIDAEIKEMDLPPVARTEERRRRTEPVLAAFRTWLDIEELLVLPKSPIGDAIRYTRNQWPALTRFLEDGRLRLDNNCSELELRREAVGRKNWLFVGNDEGGEWNATIVSLIASCKLHDIEPWAYLRDVLILVPDWPRERLLELSPKYWKQTLEHSDARQRLADSVWSRVFQLHPP